MKILVAAGGTGGHLFPVLAVVDQLKEILKTEIDFHFFGRADKIEGKILPQLGYKFHTTKLTGLVNPLSLQTLKIPFHLLKSILQLKQLINTENIDAVLCAGAYISVPAGIACRLCGKKLFLMESNVNPGKAIKLLANNSTKIYTSFDITENYFADTIKPKIRNFGNPVRKNIIEGANVDTAYSKDTAYNKFGLEKGKPVVLIFGGSLGAKAINDAVLKWINNFSKSAYQILWQTGNNFNLSADLPTNIKCIDFIDNMADAYAVADLIVSRSGATTVAELCIVGKPALLVPLPSASNEEQHLNAKYLEKHNAAIIINNADISNNLYEVVNDLMQNSRTLQEMSASLKALARPDASLNIANDIVLSVKNF